MISGFWVKTNTHKPACRMHEFGCVRSVRALTREVDECQERKLLLRASSANERAEWVSTAAHQSSWLAKMPRLLLQCWPLLARL